MNATDLLIGRSGGVLRATVVTIGVLEYYKALFWKVSLRCSKAN